MTSRHVSPFGVLLRRHRNAAGLTQEELAERAGISLRGLVALENGERLRPRRDTVRLLADALQITNDARSHFEAAARGRDELPAFQLTAPRRKIDAHATDPLFTPLVGRASELELLEWHLASHGPTVLVLTGEPGIGKTRLLRQVAEQAARQGHAVVAGGCQRRSGQEPYAPFPQALGRHLATLPAATLQEAVRESRYLVRLLPELAPLLPEPVAAPSLAANQERRLLFDAVVRLLATLARPAGAVLLLDDLQWAPTDALDLLIALVHDPASTRLRVVCAYRNTDVRPTDPLALLLADLAHAGLARQRVVEALSPHESQQLLASLVEEFDPQSAVVQRAVSRTGGVPFYLVSYAQELRSKPSASSDDVPWNVAHSLRQRVAALPALSQEVLGVAAVAGRVMPEALLASVIAQPEADVLAGLEAACRARLLEEANERAYRFPHDVIREVIEAELGAARRRLLHRQIGEALEQLPERTRTGRAAELAWHFLEGDDAEQALHYSILAGDAAETVFAHEEADHHYRTAAELARTVGDAAREAGVLEKLGWILWIVGRYDEALDILERAVEIQHAVGNVDADGEIAAKIGWVLSQEGKPEEGITRLQAAVERLEAEGPSPALVATYTSLVHLFLRQGRVRDVVAAAERASELAEAVGDDRLRVQGEMNRGLALRWQDRFDDALRVLEGVIPAAESVGDSETLARALMTAAGIYTARGELDRSKAYWERVIDLRQRTSSPDRVASALSGLGDLLFVQGDWGQAFVNLERAAGITSALTSHQAGWVRISLARLCILEGKWQDGAKYLEECLSIVESTGDRQSVPQVQALLAERDLLQGRADEALARLEPLLGHFDLDHDVLMVLAEGYVETGNTVRASEVLTQGAERAAAQNNRLALADWRRTQGMLMAGQGQWEEAERALSEAVSLASDMPYPYARARALHEWGRMCIEHGEFGEAHKRLADALAMFRRLGAQPYIERTERALAAVAFGH